MVPLNDNLNDKCQKRSAPHEHKFFERNIQRVKKDGLKLRHHRNISYSGCVLGTRKHISTCVDIVKQPASSGSQATRKDPLVNTKTLQTSHIISKPSLFYERCLKSRCHATMYGAD